MTDSKAELIKIILLQTFGKSVVSIKKLNGFEDEIFHITACSAISTEDEMDVGQFVFKIATEASQEYLDIQLKMMKYLGNNGIHTNKPCTSKNGEFTVAIGNTNGVDKQSRACLLTYLPATNLNDAGCPLHLMEDVGKLAGRIDTLLMNFESDNLRTVPTMCSWEITRVLQLEPMLHIYCTEQDADMGLQILKEYRDTILPVLGQLRKGYIHGDMTDTNILLVETDPNVSPPVFGIIDYGDVCLSLYVAELATLLANFMASVFGKHDLLHVARLLVGGYIQELPLNDEERDSLWLLTCVRMLLVYVLCGKAIGTQPGVDCTRVNRGDWIQICRDLWKLGNDGFKKAVFV